MTSRSKSPAARFSFARHRGVLVALLAGLYACDDASTPSPAVATIEFVRPGLAQALTCVDDQDRSTEDVLEYDIEAILLLNGGDPTGLTVELIIDEDEANRLSTEVPVSGVVSFPAVPLALGDRALEVRVLANGSVESTARRDVNVSIDPDDPACAGVPDLAFQIPMGGAVLDGSGDDDLADGLQIAVELVAGGAGPVALTVNGEAAGEVEPADGVARFESVTLPIGDGDDVAVTLGATQGEANAEIGVTIAIDGCDVTLLPEEVDGCLGDGADIDPATDGVQIELTARTNCGAVEFVQNGESVATVDVAGGSATQVVTLQAGANSIQANASTAGGLTGSVQQSYLAGGDITLGLDVEDGTTLTRADLNADGGWTITGTASGLEQVTVTGGGAVNELPVAPDGSFEFPVSIDYICPFEIEVIGEDPCGGDVPNEVVSICLDRVSPTLSIANPVDGAILVDNNPGQDGLQAGFAIAIDDVRPADIDYDIGVECGSEAEGFVEYSIARRPRSAAEDGVLVVPVDIRLADGTWRCRAVAAAVNNPPTTPEIEVVIDSSALAFTITSPDPEGDPACGPAPTVEGNGAGLQAANARLTAVINGTQMGEFALVPGANDSYSVALDLAEGNYTVTVAGDSDRGPVAVAPARPIPFFVDTTAPVVGLVSPAPGATLGAADDANDTLDDCIQTALTLSLADATTREICWTVNGGVEQCGAIDGTGRITTGLVDLRDGENTIAYRAIDCGGLESSGEATVSTMGCGVDPRELAITNPNDGEQVRAAQDADPAAPGCQFALTAGGDGFAEGTTFFVCADGGPADPRCPGGGAVVSTADCASAGGVARNLDCPVSVDDGAVQLAVVSSDGFSSAAIGLTVDCSPPTVESIAVVEDDGDGCVNAAELGDGDSFTVRATLTGVPDDAVITARRLAGGAALGNGTARNGSVDIAIPAFEGDVRIYLTGRDAVGNPLPVADDALLLDLTADLTAPAPALQGLAPDACLNAAADADPGAADLQYAFALRTGGDPAEVLSASLTVDDALAQTVAGAGAVVDFDPVDLTDGTHRIVLAVTDACGNTGTVGGDGVDLQVDTIPPQPSLGGVMEGQRLTADDDVDADTDGLQVELNVSFAADTGPEAGQDIDLRAGAGLLASLPADGSDGPLAQVVTLPAGDSALSAVTQDACGNEGVSAPVNVRVEAGACASRVVGFATNPAVLGPDNGVVADGALQVRVDGEVDPGCALGFVDLLVDGVSEGSVPVLLGDVSFDVTLPAGARALSLRVRVGNETADSPVQTVIVDLTAPTVTLDAPAGAEPILLDVDLDPGTPGQQVNVAATVTEAPVNSAREARVEVNGAIVAGPIAVPAGSPRALDFGAVTLGADSGTLAVCVTDAAGNEGCESVEFNADATGPGVVDPSVVITNPRRTRVRVDFVAPGDDGDAGGRVTRYRVRAASAPIETEEDWAAARQILASGASADPGENQRLVLDRLLALNAVHHIAVRAYDEFERPGGWVSTMVDLRMNTRTADLDANWDGDDFFNGGSLVVGAGDTNNDGQDDVLVYGNQIGGQAAAMLFMGGAADGRTVALELDPNTSFAATDGGAVGDVNGDGFPDVALLGYTPAFDASRVVLYFGCDRCDDAELASPDSVISIPGRLTNFVTGVGNFSRPNGADDIDDLLIGGSPGGGGPTAFVVEGRAAWPAELDATVADNGVITLGLPVDNAGVFAAGTGDLDGDGSAEVVLGAGGNFERSFVFYGGINLDADYTYDMNDPATVELLNPCVENSVSFGSWFAGGADLDGDMRPDFLVGARGHKRIIPFDADLQSLDCVGRAEVQFGVNFDLAGDLNEDGFIDLIATHRDDQGRPFDALAFYNDGTGQFGGDGVQAVADVRFTEAAVVRLGAAGVGDVNGDGRPDVATVYKVPGGALRAIVYY